MRDLLGPGTWVGYCTNVHAGSTLEETKANLAQHSVAVRERLGITGPLGIGLWLSADAAATLVADPDGPQRFRDWLDAHRLAVFTMNGFPYGDFHAPVVKEKVYEPTWETVERVKYTANLAEILATIAPPGEASISTLPLGWNGYLGDGEQTDACVNHLVAMCFLLNELEHRTGRRVHLDLEPEPLCVLSTADDVVAFFEEHLWPTLSAAVGEGGADLRHYIRVCHDICHSAVMFEDQTEVLELYRSHEIPVGKVQVSSAVAARLPAPADPTHSAVLDALSRFDEARYLHQTGVRHGGDGMWFDDLPEAIAAVIKWEGGLPGPADEGTDWRVHFHVPLFLDRLNESLMTTQDQIDAAIAGALKAGVQHFEIETYAWDVLPPEHRPDDLADGIARELTWFRDTFATDRESV